jgi:hypothetical protein
VDEFLTVSAVGAVVTIPIRRLGEVSVSAGRSVFDGMTDRGERPRVQLRDGVGAVNAADAGGALTAELRKPAV